MSNFVINGTSLPFPKANLVPLPPGADPTKWVQNIDWNTVCQGLTDVQGFLRAAPWYGFAAQSSDPAPSGITSYMWMGTDTQMHAKNGATVVTFATSTTALTNTKVPKANASGQLVDSSITDTGSLVTVANQQTVTGIITTNGRFVCSMAAGVGPMLDLKQVGQTEWQIYQLGSSDPLSIWCSAVGSDIMRFNNAGKGEAFFDWQVDGTFTAAANTNFLPVASPSTPSTGVNIVGNSIAGRAMPTYKDPAGIIAQMQPFTGRKRIASLIPCPFSTNVTLSGITHTIVGTINQRNVTSASFFTSCGARAGYTSAASASSACGTYDANINSYWRGNAAGLGGFTFVCRFGISDPVIVSTGQMFVGLKPTALLTSVNPSTFINCIGVGCDSGDTQLQLYASGGTAQARVALGVNFPANTVTNQDIYELIIYAPPNGTTIGYTVNRLNTGATTSGVVSVAANLFSTTTFVAPAIMRANGATAAAAAIDLLGLYIETEF